MFTFDGLLCPDVSFYATRFFYGKKTAPENPERNNATVEKEESKFSLDDFEKINSTRERARFTFFVKCSVHRLKTNTFI